MSMTQAREVKIAAFGAADVMGIETRDLPAPGPGEVQLRQSAIGFNYIDVYQRSGIYPLPLPSGLGHEAAGIIAAVGSDVRDLKVGDHVAYMNAGLGAYADLRNVPAERLVKVPAGISDEQAAALIFKGLTAQYLVKKTYAVQPGDMVLIHAAAGGVGQILASWTKALGAFVVGTAGSPEKVATAIAAGCDVAVDYSKPDWVEKVLEATGGRKARVVYDSVGKDTLLKSLDLTAPFGLVVSYGAASGKQPPIDPEMLNKKGCLFLTRPSVFPHNADVATFRANAADLFDAVAAGMVKATIGARFPLADVVKAHEAAEARTTQGAILLIP
ncbi:quinone oxidoreductase family protein [Roseixanthobacter glucoisosaccharinicivorans]|uniref:quinone oxidoreductase family protein n=1 Tax=Roseixanthobacter glucoisosaccharinicivorans TaxID=3119923 RepID=UPI0037271C5C